MNERIKELAQEANEAFHKQMCEGAARGIFYFDGFADGFAKAFAEMIVRECAMFVVTELEGKVGSRIADATANRLEEHFGVTE